MIYSITIGFPHLALAEYLGTLGFSYVVADGEHGPINDERLEQLAIGARSGGAALILRTPSTTPGMQRYLDFGVDGIQLPRVRSAAEVNAAVENIMYRPTGSRGLGAGRANRWGVWPGGLAGYADDSRNKPFIAVQVEDQQGLDNLDEIADIPEVDLLLAGPTDLAESLGVRGQDSPAVRQAVMRILGSARAAAKLAGLPARNPADVDAARRLGADFVLMSVPSLLRNAAMSLGLEERPPDVTEPHWTTSG